eukprot:m.16570 g.16570  ORF g.16570 m.16570 type:complete len:240 (+) comp8023_c0_seq1:96-815(+)
MALVFLDDFLELVEELPSEMKQRFTELRRLDSLYQAHLQRGEERQSEFFESATKSQSKANLQEMCQPILKEYHHARRVLKDKRSLIKKTREMMSRILDHLGSQLKEYEQELESQTQGTTADLKERSILLDSETIPYHEFPVKGGRVKLSARVSQRSSVHPQKKKKMATAPEQTPIIEEENSGEVFCYCKQGSFGEMVGCDNDNCPIEWFHYQCVGLTSAPQGSWFCPECRGNMKKKKRK